MRRRLTTDEPDAVSVFAVCAFICLFCPICTKQSICADLLPVIPGAASLYSLSVLPVTYAQPSAPTAIAKLLGEDCTRVEYMRLDRLGSSFATNVVEFKGPDVIGKSAESV